MKQLRKILALIISLAIVVPAIPAMSSNLETKAADSFAITSPEKNELKAAGYIDIEWTEATSSTVKNYQLYIDDELVTTTTETSYEYYTTKVKAFNTYVKANFTNGTSRITETITFGVTKKGLGLASDMGANLDLAAMGIGWYYNWGTGPSSGQQYKGIEFVPMQWGNDSYNNINNRMNNWAAKGYKYALAFNEPDLNGQGVTSVDDAVNRWPAFQNHGIRVGSPASFLWPSISSWLKDFMVKIDNNVDFVTIHCYPDNNPGGKSMADWFLKEVVDSAWELYHKPIWITEFSTSDKTDNNTAVTAQGTADFWKYVMQGLDEREYVERYAAFGFKAESKPGVGLWYYNTGELTLGGEVYKEYGNPENFTPSNQIDPGYKITESTRNTLLADKVLINGVTCDDYVKENGVTATATSEFNAGSGADKAIDENIKTRWESVHNVDPQSLTIDLGVSRSIKQVSIAWENASASNYSIELSEDGVNYTTIALAESMSSKQNREDTIKLTTMAKGRYVKINGTSRTTQYGYSIYDIAIYGTDDAKVDETTTPAPTTPRPTTTPTPTTASIQDEGKKLNVLNGATFTGYVGSWANSSGSVTADTNGDATIKITASGGGWANAIWGIQAQYQKIEVVPGNTYKYTATIKSDKDKKITIKTSPSGVDEPLVQDVITLKAGVTYTYEAEFVATSASVDIVYAFGSPAGEASVQNANITIKENDLVVTKEVVTNEVVTTPSAEETTAESQADKVTTTKKLGKTKVTKAAKKKASKKVKITLKRIKGAQKYQLQISTTKKFKKKLVKRTVKRVKLTVTSKRIKNKKKLYVRARAMRVVGKKKSYGSWSKPKRVKVRK